MASNDPRVAQIANKIRASKVQPKPSEGPKTSNPKPTSSKLEPGAYMQPDGSIIRVTPEGMMETVDQLDAAPIMAMIIKVREENETQLTQMALMITQLTEAITAPKEVVRGPNGLITGIKPKTGV